MRSQDFLRGSEWRKWDLHIHSKYSQESRTNLTIEEIFTQAVKNGLDVISVTDHSNVDSLDEVWEFWESKKIKIGDDEIVIKDEIDFLPGIELKTDKGKNGAHVVVVFPKFIGDNKVDKAYLQQEFLAKIDCTKAKVEEVGENDYKMGLFKINVDFEVMSDRVRELGGLVIAHAGTKDNGIEVEIRHERDSENELDILNSLGSRKQTLMKENIDICEVQNWNENNQKEAKFYLDTFNKPTILCSDSHEKIDGAKFTWIKAEPTFEGLKQIIYEPIDRVCIGKIPEVIERVKGNKTKYIDTLKIDQIYEYDKKQGTWFERVNIPFNKELVAIIGNKGSGKSALSDIIGLLGSTRNAGLKQENLTFLNGKNKKFKKRGYAENFEAELIWEDGTGDGEKVSLDKDIDINLSEKVRYLPQNYFETLTNELEGTGFDETLKSVTFNHIKEENRLGTSTFDELEKSKIKNIETDLFDLKEDLHKISETIIELESKKHPDNVKRLNSLIAEKQKELNEHIKNEPQSVPDPSKEEKLDSEEGVSDKSKELEELNKQQEEIIELISQKRTELNSLVKEKEELNQILVELQRFDTQIKEYKSNSKGKLEKFGIDVESIIKLKVDFNSVKVLISEKEEKIIKLNESFETKEKIDAKVVAFDLDQKKEYEKSLIIKQEELNDKIDKLKNILTKPQKDFQEYIEKRRLWQSAKRSIEGAHDIPGTLKFYESEKDYLDRNLTTDLDKARKERMKKTIEILNKKKEIVDMYNSLKQSIDSQISKDKEFTEKFNMEIEAGFRLSPDFAVQFLNLINKTKKGTFRGAEEKQVLELFSEKNLLNEKDVEEVLSTIILFLEQDQSVGKKGDENKREISDQVHKIQNFYDFIFSLDYLKPIYELKLDGKILDELSPGEKGALLLVFYLMIDKEDIPLIIDQPEDNLDNKSVFQVLTHFIKSAKKRRQIIIVTHNPNLAVGADAEQIIYVELDKKDNKYDFHYELGAIENSRINKRVVEILEGTMPAFDKRKLKYFKDK